MSAVPRPELVEQMGCLEAMAIVLREVRDGDPLDKWLLHAIADVGTLDAKPLSAYTLIPERDVATRVLRLQFETDLIERLRGRWDGP